MSEAEPLWQAYWHIHHAKLLGFSHNIQERIDYIRARKSANEIETRLRWLTPVSGELPSALQKADAAWQTAAWMKVYAAWPTAHVAEEKAYAASLPDLEKLHAVEHPGCPWNGSTLFPDRSHL